MSAYHFINPAMIKLLRSPGHRVMSKRIMIVSYRGRKSDKDYDTPVSYYRDGDTVYCFTNGVWRHNFIEPRQASLRIAGRDYEATGHLFDGSREQQTELMSEYFKAVPQDKKFYGVHCDSEGEPITAQVEQATYAVVAIEFTLQR